jgi:hypothetical protein
LSNNNGKENENEEFIPLLIWLKAGLDDCRCEVTMTPRKCVMLTAVFENYYL